MFIINYIKYRIFGILPKKDILAFLNRANKIENPSILSLYLKNINK